MSDILVTVIVPIYNVEKYLVECLDSLTRQTLKNIEVILINDGSTDASEDIAREYADREDNFILINRSNGGLSAARNTGIVSAHGEYIYFIDSDDFLADDALEKLYNKSKKENLDVLRFAAYTFEDGTCDYIWSRDISDGGYVYLGEYQGVFRGIDFYQKTIENDDYYPSCCLIFIKKSVIEENCLRFYEGILHEDNLFNFQLTTLCARVAVLNEPLYYRRIRTGSITQGHNWLQRNKAMCISAIEADKFIEEHPELRGKTADWQIKFFLNTMLRQWELLTRQEQESQESIDYCESVRHLAKKYGGSKSLKLFYTSRSLYRVYRVVRHMVSKMMDRN